MNANAAAAAAELHLKMCKKVAQLTKVIFQLNTRNEDYAAEAEHCRVTHATEITKLTQDAAEKMKTLQSKLQTHAATAAQRERQHVADRQKLTKETQQQQRRSQASRAAAEEAFQDKVAALETQVQDARRAFDDRIEQLRQVSVANETQRVLSYQDAAVAFETRLDELQRQHTDEVEQLVTKSNAKYNKMLAEQLRAQDALKAELVNAEHEWGKQTQEVTAEHERQRVDQDMNAQAAFDTMKHELVTKIEALLVDVEALRGKETKLRQEKEIMVKDQQQAARTMKQLELQLSKTQHESQSVRRDASAHSEELQRMLAVSTEKIDELAQEIVTLKQTLQTRDRALVQAQKDLETAQFETLQQTASASELSARLRQQLDEHALQVAIRNRETLIACQEIEAGQKQIQKLEAELVETQKAVVEMQTEGATHAVTRSKLKQELEHVAADAKQAKVDYEQALDALKQTHESKLQQLMSSHTQEMETQRSDAVKQLEELEKRIKEAALRSSEDKMTELKQHKQVLSEYEAALTKLRDENVKLKKQVQKLQEQVTAQSQQLIDWQMKQIDTTRRLESSQQQMRALQSATDALQSSTLKSQRERDKTHQKQLRELETQHENVVKALTMEKNQLEQHHSQVLLELVQKHTVTLQTTTEQLEAQKLKELSAQDATMRELYEPQLMKLRQDLETLQRVLEASTEEATETRRSLEETRLLEQEQLHSALVAYAECTAAEAARVQLAARQELETLQLTHSQHVLDLEKRLMDESRAQLAGFQTKTHFDFTRLAANHQLELETSVQEHAKAMEKLQETLSKAHERAILAERTDATKQLHALSLKKDQERSVALLEAQHTHDQQYGELRTRLDSTEEALTKKTLDWANVMRQAQNLSATLAAKTQEMTLNVSALEKISREQVETLKLAAKREMDKLLEENLSETKQLSDQFEETRRVMTDKVAYLKTMISEWEDKYTRRESRSEDVARIVELERLVAEKDALARRTLDEMAYIKRELLNREEMYNKTFARCPNVGMLQVLKPHVQMQQMLATPPPRAHGKLKTFEQSGELQRRRSERSGLTASLPSSAASAMNQKALPPLHNNQFSA